LSGAAKVRGGWLRHPGAGPRLEPAHSQGVDLDWAGPAFGASV
jgi:hypothetical protein